MEMAKVAPEMPVAQVEAVTTTKDRFGPAYVFSRLFVFFFTLSAHFILSTHLSCTISTFFFVLCVMQVWITERTHSLSHPHTRRRFLRHERTNTVWWSHKSSRLWSCVVLKVRIDTELLHLVRTPKTWTMRQPACFTFTRRVTVVREFSAAWIDRWLYTYMKVVLVTEMFCSRWWNRSIFRDVYVAVDLRWKYIQEAID